jgi:Protein of unknown function (DUF642)
MKSAFLSASVVVLCCATVHAQNLIKDGGFETPVVPAGSYTMFPQGQTLGPWTVLYQNDQYSPSVTLMSTTYQNGEHTLNAHSGHQSIDLVFGVANSVQGIEQSVPTITGESYVLSFWLGSCEDLDDAHGLSSLGQVDVLINDMFATSAIVVGTPNTTVQHWQKFSYKLTATSDHTKITFLSTMGDYNFVGLDDVQLVEAP